MSNGKWDLKTEQDAIESFFHAALMLLKCGKLELWQFKLMNEHFFECLRYRHKKRGLKS